MEDKYNNNKNRYITLADLNIGSLPETLEFDGETFVIKPEFHITLLAVGQIAELIDTKNVEKLKLEIVNDFYKFISELPLTKYKLLDELRLVEVNSSKTIIVMARVEAIEKLFDQLGKKYKNKLPLQPTHITLYTLPIDTFGIPILSYEELDDTSRVIDLPKLKSLL